MKCCLLLLLDCNQPQRRAPRYRAVASRLLHSASGRGVLQQRGQRGSGQANSNGGQLFGSRSEAAGAWWNNLGTQLQCAYLLCQQPRCKLALDWRPATSRLPGRLLDAGHCCHAVCAVRVVLSRVVIEKTLTGCKFNYEDQNDSAINQNKPRQVAARRGATQPRECRT